MNRMKGTVTGLASGLALFISASGCATEETSSQTSETRIDATLGESSDDFNDADVMFAQMMIPHHEQAIELSDIALDPQTAASQAVRGLAQQIKDDQDPEIDAMTSLLTSWAQPMAMDSSMDHSSMMSGMLSLDDLASLSQLRGAEFDQAWIQAMIAHHEGAIEMAQDVIDDGSNGSLRTLANQIIVGQRAEIEEMRSLLG